jgi:hypothetical protein
MVFLAVILVGVQLFWLIGAALCRGTNLNDLSRADQPSGMIPPHG